MSAPDLNESVAARDVKGQPALPDDLHPRHLARRLVEIAGLVALVVIALSAFPNLEEVRIRLESADPVWITLLVVAEIGSCAGYMLVFRATFCSRMPWGLSYDISMAELAADSLLPAGGAGGLALGAWALHGAGMQTSHIARRSVAFFVVTSAPNFFSLIFVGIGVFVGIVPGLPSPVLTLVPAIVTALGVVIVAGSPRLLRRLGRLGKPDPVPAPSGWGGRASLAVRTGLTTIADGVDQAITLLRSHGFGSIVGSFSYMAFDIAALGFAFVAVGDAPPLGTLVLGYLIGQLGNLIPVPGGIGSTEGALIGVFALYGVNLTEATAAVFAYRLFQLSIPAVLGAPAFVALRRKLMRAQQPALVCDPLGREAAELGGMS
jgi:uncharacterized protein (TIRG00374 family)